MKKENYESHESARMKKISCWGKIVSEKQPISVDSRDS